MCPAPYVCPWAWSSRISLKTTFKILHSEGCFKLFRTSEKEWKEMHNYEMA